MIASKNISMGPITQLSNKETPNTLVFLKTSFSLSYRTLVKGGYIIKINPMAKGILVVPVEKELMKPEDEGKKYPIPTPIIIAKKIQRVRKRSKKPSFFLSSAGAQLFADIFVWIVFFK